MGIENFKHKDITQGIIGAAMKVHRKLGCGFQEIIYQRCLGIELDNIGIKFIRERKIPIFYENLKVGERKVDFLVENVVLVELKATSKIEDVHIAQAINYLEAFRLEVGLLINFGAKSLEFKRLFKNFNNN